MITYIAYFRCLLHTTLSLFLGQESEYASIEEIPQPGNEWMSSLLGDQEISFKEQTILLLALMPHISPEVLNIFFIKNKDYDRPYTEFGGWQGISHGGFLPTGQTAKFLIENGKLKVESKIGLSQNDNTFNSQLSILHLFSKDHWFHKENILCLEGQAEGEPFLSGRLVVSEEFLAKVLHNGKYEPEYNVQFPAKRITTPLDWDDLVLPWHLYDELNDISRWLQYQTEIRDTWNLNRIIKPGYRCLFYGPPGTGKTLTATLLGKQNNMEVYRVDLSMIVSKYIGETEKNLAKVFDRAEHQNWILFFDEADALFSQRTETQSSNDRHANQEVAYLLQRIEDHPGTVILASNLKENIDEAFFRRFQSAIAFPMPDKELRYTLWKKMIPSAWLGKDSEDLLQQAALHTLSGGSIVNIIQHCAIKLHASKDKQLNPEILKNGIKKEIMKEGKLIEY